MAEIDKASGFKFTSEKLNQSFDLEDLVDDQGKLKSTQEGTIFFLDKGIYNTR